MRTEAILTTTAPVDAAALKRTGAAQDFEALLIAQMLRSVREETDASGAPLLGLGEEQLARTLAKSGGLGLSKLIQSGLKR